MKKALIVALAAPLLIAILIVAQLRDSSCANRIVQAPLPKPLTPSEARLENGDVAIGLIDVRNNQIAMVKEHRRYCANRARGWLGTLDNLRLPLTLG